MEKENKPSTIKNFLERFKKLGVSNKKIREEFLYILQKEYNVHVNEEQVRVVQNHIYVRTTPIRKTEILKHKEVIVLRLKEKLNLSFLEIS